METNKIKKWLIDNGLTQRDIAKKANVGDSAVHYFVKGYMVSAKVEAVFRQLGCPVEFLERKTA